MKSKQSFAILPYVLLLFTILSPFSAFAASERQKDISPVEIAEREKESDISEDSDLVEVEEININQTESADQPGEEVSDLILQNELVEIEEEIPLIKISEPEFPAFMQSQTMGDITVSVSADEGVFPTDAVLSVMRVRTCPDEAIGELRSSDTAVAVSYTFDIKVIDPVTGEEYQPAEGQTVSVSFCVAEVADQNLDTNVYHISDDGNAEALDVTTSGKTATAQTNGFSLYTVEFTYNSLQYVLPGDSEVPLSTILEAVGLTGEVTEVQVSNPSLFSAFDETGEWVVKALSAFQTNEWMKVTIDGVVFEIKVTDTENIASGEGWNLDTDGCLHITGAVSYSGYTAPWSSVRSSIKTVVAESGSSINNCNGLFSNCENLTSVDLSGLDTSAVTDMQQMFNGCAGLTSIVLTGINTSPVTSMERMFYDCSSLTDLDLGGFDTSHVTSMDDMFTNCSRLTTLNVRGWDTSHVDSMARMFFNCSSLENLDLSGFDVSYVSGMFAMFYGCSSLSTLNLNGWNTSRCSHMQYMFYDCSSLISLDLSGFDISSMDGSEWLGDMLTGCSSIEELCINRNLLNIIIEQIIEILPESYNESNGTGYFKKDDFDDISNTITIAKYKIQVNTEGNGSASANEFASPSGKTVTLEATPQADYHFVKWQSDDVTVADDNTFEMLGKHVTITAIFEINEYKVTFDARNHGTAPSEQTVKYGETATDPGNLTENGYTFDGWYTDASLTTAYDFNSAVTADLTLYAKWVQNGTQPPESTYYTVSFNMSEHGAQIPEQKVADGAKATKPTDPTESGWTFGGWYTDTALTVAYDFNTAVHANLTLYAKWTLNGPQPIEPADYTVSFNMGGHGTQIAGQTVSGGGNAVKPADPVAGGYAFCGWYTESTFQMPFDFNTVIHSDTTVYARWTPNGPQPIEPADYTDSAFQTSFDYNAAIHSDTTLYTKWMTDSVKPIDSSLPKTGDNSHMLLWVLLLAVSGAGLIGTAIYSRKKTD